MLKRSSLSILAAVALPACVGGSGTATSNTTQPIARDVCPANTPASLAPAADQDLLFTLDATGTQNYTCTASGWSFVGPDADLYLPHEVEAIVGHHFAGATGPTWEYEDGSSVIGKKAAGKTVDPSAIPWLLLVAIGHDDVDGRMTDVTSVQRLSTSGGNAPATGCDVNHIGATVDVPYTATYYFYVTRDPNKSNNLRCGA